MLDYLNLPNLKTLKVQDIGKHEILVHVEGVRRDARTARANIWSATGRR